MSCIYIQVYVLQFKATVLMNIKPVIDLVLRGFVHLTKSPMQIKLNTIFRAYNIYWYLGAKKFSIPYLPYLLYFSLNINHISHCRLIIFSVYNIWWEMIFQKVSVNLMLFPNLPNSYTYYTRMVFSNVLDLA